MTSDQLDLIDPHGLAEQAGRQATLTELAEAVMGEVDRANTTRAFAGDWRLWLAFCEMAQRAGHVDALPLTVSASNLVVFSKWLAGGGAMPDGRNRKPAAPESIRRRLTGVLAGWRENGVDYPRGISANARRWTDDYQSKLVERGEPTGRGQAPALTVPDLRKIVTATWADTSPKYPHLAKVRDVALVLMTFSVGARQSELAFLDVADITAHESGVRQESGLLVHIRKSKTGRPRKPKVKYGEFEATCPVLAWRRWQAASGIITGAAFRTVAWHGALGGRMSGEAVSDCLGRAGQRAGLEHRLTGHSPRRGLVTEATRAGRKPHQIADQGGWRRGSAAMQGYIDDVEGWTDNVLAGIGL